jgi:NADH dehydrogenase
VFVVGDLASLNGYPGVAQVAIQGARHSARAIRKGERKPFVYKDKGSMATVSRFYAVASIKGLRFSGFFAWLLWLAVHIVYIVGFKKRLTTVLHWAVSFVGRGRSERVATEQQVLARLALEEVGPAFVSLAEPKPAPKPRATAPRKAKAVAPKKAVSQPRAVAAQTRAGAPAKGVAQTKGKRTAKSA